MTKMLLAVFALCAFSINSQAIIPGVPSQALNIVRMPELAQHQETEDQQATDDEKAQAQANATGAPVYANGGVYLPAQKPAPQ